MIAKQLEWTISNVKQNIEQLQTPTVGNNKLRIKKKQTERPP